MTDSKITIYGASWCGPCHMTKGYLDSIKVKYNYVDVDQDPARGLEALEKSGQRGIPVIDMDGDIIVGFDRQTIDVLLKSHNLV